MAVSGSAASLHNLAVRQSTLTESSRMQLLFILRQRSGKITETTTLWVYDDTVAGHWSIVHLVTHFLTGWSLANIVPLERRDRAVVTVAAIIPDADALGLVVEHTPLHTIIPAYWFSEYHHVLSHNLGFALLFTVFAGIVCRNRLTGAFLAFAAFHIHLLGDITGSRGPDGYQWPIPYFWPLSNNWQLTWQGQWMLDAWPNMMLTLLLLGLTFRLAWKRGYSPLEMLSRKADARFVETLRMRFGMP